MKNEFAPYDIALGAKELGFDEPCIACYNGLKDLYSFNHIEDFYTIRNSSNFNEEVSAPLYQQLFRWFREEHDVFASVGYMDDLKSEWGASIKGLYETWGKYDLGFTGWFKTYDEAQDACLRKLIEIVKEKRYENN